MVIDLGPHGLQRDTIALYLSARGKACDLCGDPFDWHNGRYLYAIDHLHDHCGANRGCPDCVRGFLCYPCNSLEGVVTKAARLGWAKVAGPLAVYLADPPFQKWRLENGTTQAVTALQ